MLRVKFLIFFFLFQLPTIFFPAAQADAEQLNIGAAASLQDVLQDAGNIWMKKAQISARISYNFAGSSTLLRQAKLGAPLDIFISAAKNHANQLLEEQLGIEDSLKILATNTLVLVSNKSKKPVEPLSLQQIAKTAGIKVATCDKAVPIGYYTQSYLRKLGLYDQFKPKFVYTDHARSILGMVATESTDYGFVYLTDALTDSRVKIVTKASHTAHHPIEYVGLVLTRANKNRQKLASAFLDFLKSQAGQAIFAKHGFQKARVQFASQ